MKDKTVLRTGVVGSVVAALCCFTPLVVVVGLSAALAWLDYVLFPALAVFLGMTGYGLWRLKSN